AELGGGDGGRQRRHVAEYEPFEDHQKRNRDDGNERVLDERLEPAPEQPIELWDDEERYEDWTEQAAHRARDQTERDHCQRQRLGKRDEDEDRPVDQVRQDRPRV